MSRKDRALAARIPFRYGGVDYLVPPAVEWMLEAKALLAENKLDATIRLILGPDQYAKFRTTKPNIGDAAALIGAIGSAFQVVTLKHVPRRHFPRKGRGRR